MNIIHWILMFLALLLFALAAVGVSAPRGNLIAGGLFCWVLAELIGRP